MFLCCSRRSGFAPVLLAAWSLSSSAASAQFMQRASVGDFGDDGSFAGDCDVSADGRFVVFTASGQFNSGDTNNFEDVYLKDMGTGALEVVSLTNDGVLANGRSNMGRVSDDGNVVVFASDATNLVEGDTNGQIDVFVRDRAAGTTSRVSVDENGLQATLPSLRPEVSGDGHLVAFETQAALVASDVGGEVDVYGFDRNRGKIARVSVAFDGGVPDGSSHHPSIDASGRHIAFDSTGDRIIEDDTNDSLDVFVRDVEAQTTIRVSLDSKGDAVRGASLSPSINAGGSIVAFQSFSSTLVAQDTNGKADLFVHDGNTGETRRVSIASDGTEANGDSFDASISGDGEVVAFDTIATNLLADGQSSQAQALVRDRVAKTTTLVSETTLGRVGGSYATLPRTSSDGRFVAFYSAAKNLIPRDPVDGIFRRDRFAPPDSAYTLDYGDGFAGTLGVPALSTSAAPSLGTAITLGATNSYGLWTLGLLVTGSSQTAVVLRGGGTLLATPDLLTVVPVPPWDFSLDVDLPFDEDLAGIDVYAQILELDYGAPGKLSFSEGLQLHFGR